MTKHNFPNVMAEVFKHEGGYVDHPHDPGGATNMGITHNTLARSRKVDRVTKADVRHLQKAEAMQIYRKSYWAAVRGDDLPCGLDLVAMDGAVNSGPTRGIRWLQVGVGAQVDGVMGPETLGRARSANTQQAISRACAARMGFLRALRHWKTFGRGWSRRVAEVEAGATEMHLMTIGRAVRPAATVAAASARKAADAERTNGVAQGAGVAVGAPAVDQVAPLPAEVWPVVVVAVLIAVTVVMLRSTRRRRFQLDRAAAFKQIEVKHAQT